MHLILMAIVNAVALWFATVVVPGVSVVAPQGPWWWKVLGFVGLGVLFGLVNAVIKPVVSLLSLPVTVLTLGLFLLVINAFMLKLTAWLSSFTPVNLIVDRFFWSAIFGSIVVSFAVWVLQAVLPDGRDA